MTGTELKQLRQARRTLERVGQALACPSTETLDSGAAELEEAIGKLREFERTLHASGGNLRRSREINSEVDAMRNAMRRAEALLAAAGRFYAGWARMTAAAGESGAANYTAGGKPGRAPIPIDCGKAVLHG